MTTVDRAFAENIMKHNGFYNGESDNTLGDNPRAVRIVEYTNAWGSKAYGVTFENETIDRQRRYLEESPYIREPKVIWTYEEPATSKKEEKQTLQEDPPPPLNMEGREMVKAEERRGVMFDLMSPFRMAIMVAQDGVWIHFFPSTGPAQGMCVNVDAIGPQTKDSLIRKGLDQWVRDLEATCEALKSGALAVPTLAEDQSQVH